ncbi:hypothetical protein ACFO3K_01875 [Cellulomonas algicola]|uniref:hypothetical protein n=1 Tax=Cellulomonas algicola TaxID=2071633 RepID=UPI001C3F99F0|nr:hypothetical protein [Cellulomonas algicola]
MSISEDEEAPISAVPLLSLPYTFTQVGLLSSRQFREQAEAWGHRLTAGDLSWLDEHRLLVPLLRLRGTPGHPLTTADGDETYEAELAREGRLGDTWATDNGTPGSDEPLYSHWQLLALRTALPTRRNIEMGLDLEAAARSAAARERSTHIALAALTNRFFPAIIGKLTAPRGSDFVSLRRAARDLDAKTRLGAVHAQPETLRREAEWMLSVAHAHDPLGGWWQVARHSNHRGWFQLKKAALEAVWQRIAAEVLLRAHEELAEAGHVAPLPEVTGSWWMPLMDRISATGPAAPHLDHALQRMAISPHPSAIVVVEGATEELHVTTLLEELGWSRRVRVVNQQTSGDHPHEIARFVAPQVRDVLPDRQVLERNPTTMFVVMDPEGPWAEEKREGTEKTLRQHLREEVEQHGGSITDGELDELLKVRTWQGATYEFANFTDDELVEALTAVAPRYAAPADDLRAEIAEHLAYARSGAHDFKVVLDRLRWGNLKTRVANQLIPVLVSKLDLDTAPQVVELVREIVVAASGTASATIHLAGSATDAAEQAQDAPAKPR